MSAHRAALTLELAGETVLLLAAKALYWPRARMLVVADLHFGKAASFRALGVPVPRGTTSANLAALDALLIVHDVAHIVFLGDFLHAKASHAESTMAALQTWRTRHAQLRLTLVIGNHDRHAGAPPAALGIALVEEPWRQGPFALCHHPDVPADGAYVLAGHVHPAARLAAGRETLRLPCFVVGAARAVLPSFGAFTGGHTVRAQAGERLYGVADDAIFALPEQT